MLATAYLVGPLPSAEIEEAPVARQLRALGYQVVELPVAPPSDQAVADQVMADQVMADQVDGPEDSGAIAARHEGVAPDASGLSPQAAARAGQLTAAVRDADPGPVAVVDRRYIGHLHVLRQILRDSRFEVSTGPGAVVVSAGARQRLLDVLPQAGTDIQAIAGGLAEWGEVREVNPAPLVAALADDEEDREALQARVDAVDEEEVRLRAAVKSDDTFFTTFTVRSYSGYAARWLARRGVTPNQVTIFSLLVALGAAAVVATGTRTGYVLGALLFHLSFALDCIDGDLARYSLRFTRLGAFLDATFDRLKEYALYAGLAFGAIRMQGSDQDATTLVWALAAAAMALQTLRHQMHFAYEEVTAGPDEAPPLAAELQSRLAGSRAKVWLRRAAVLPQGERSALLCLLIIFTTPVITFVVMLAAGVLAGAYGFLGRLLRSLKRLHRGWSRRAARSIGAMVDVGPIGWIVHRGLPGRSLPAPLTTLLALLVLAGALVMTRSHVSTWLWIGVLWYLLLVSFASRQPLNGWADWVLPPSFRAAEYGLAIVLVASIEPVALPAAFAYIAACAYHHYDTVYRLRGAGTPPPRWLILATGGHDARMLALAALAAAGAPVLGIGLAVLAVYLVVLFLAESVVNTVSWVHSEDTPPSEPAGHTEFRAPDEEFTPAEPDLERLTVETDRGDAR